MNKERLEEIKEAIANELGLSEQHLDGTYLYYLTRTKSAFSVGTVTLDDFEEVDGELLEDIFNVIKPFVISQAERVQELESHITKMAIARYKDSEELDETHEQNKRYREAIEELNKIYNKEKSKESDGLNYQEGYLDGLDRAIGFLEALERDTQ